jgi:hypothetical protein
MKGKLVDLVTGIAGVAGIEGVDQVADAVTQTAEQASSMHPAADWTAIVGQVLVALATFWKLIFGSPEQIAARKEARRAKREARKAERSQGREQQ